MTRAQGVVILGAMRSGSNYLEEGMCRFPEFRGFGEVFNPGFVGQPDRPTLPGVTPQNCTRDPAAVLDYLLTTPKTPVFRWFDGHCAKALKVVAQDPRWAKVVLTRRLLDRFVSLEVAKATGQWRLRSEDARKRKRIDFDRTQFDEFQRAAEKALHVTERAIAETDVFRVDYDDLLSRRMWRELAEWLEVPKPRKRPAPNLLRQNPGSLAQKVTNPGDLPSQTQLTRGAPPSRVVLRDRARVAYSGYVPQWFCRSLAVLDGEAPTILTSDRAASWRDYAAGYSSVAIVADPAALVLEAQKAPSNRLPDIIETLRALKRCPVHLRPLAYQSQARRLPVADRWISFIELCASLDLDLPALPESPRLRKLANALWAEDIEAFGLGDQAAATDGASVRMV